MICPNCGKDCGNGTFCIYCGSRLPSFGEASHNEETFRGIPADPIDEENVYPTDPMKGFEPPARQYEPAPARQYDAPPARQYDAPPARQYEPARPVRTAEPKPKKVRKAGKWPIIIPILLLLAFGAALLAQITGAVSIISNHVLFKDIYRVFPEIFHLSFFPLVGAVLFFLHTKKKAIFTAIPYFVYIIPALVLVGIEISFIVKTKDWYSNAYNFFYLLIPLISIALAVIYGVGAAVKKKTHVFVELYIIGAAAALAIIAVLNVPSFFGMLQYCIKERYMNFGMFMKQSGWRNLYDFFAWFTAFFTHIACVLALKEKAKDN